MRRRNRGFTLVEVVIAVSIAVIVSIAAASVIISTRTTTDEAKYKNNAVSYANNIMESFKSAKNFNEFKKGLEFTFFDAVGSSAERGEFDTSTWSDGDTFYLYMNDNGTLTSDENTVSTAWNAANTKKPCRYVVAINVTGCVTGNEFSATTKLNVAVYLVVNQYTDEPNISSAEADGNVIYHFKYKKGVAD